MYKFSQAIFIFFLVVLVLPAWSQDDDETDADSLVSSSFFHENQSSRFKPIVPTEPISVRQVPDKNLRAIKEDDAYWYANVERAKKVKDAAAPARSSSLNQGWLLNLLWIVVLGTFIGAVVWYLASGNIGLFRKRAAVISEEEDEEAIEDIFTLNYQKLIDAALKEKNYRLAVRLHYLQILKELSHRNLIEYGHDKTNSIYLNKLSGSRYYREFFSLTRNFEYTWYGNFPLSEEGYKNIERDFLKFKSSPLS